MPCLFHPFCMYLEEQKDMNSNIHTTSTPTSLKNNADL